MKSELLLRTLGLRRHPLFWRVHEKNASLSKPPHILTVKDRDIDGRVTRESSSEKKTWFRRCKGV